MITGRQLSLSNLRNSARRLLSSCSFSPSSPPPLRPPPPPSPALELKPPFSPFFSAPTFQWSSSSHYSSRHHRSYFIAAHVPRFRLFSTHRAVDHQASGIVEVPLAQTGEGIAECELLKWYVQEGDEVEEFQPLCEVQSDKATIEITSRYKGKVSEILHDPGHIVKVGETLLKMAVEEDFSTLSSEDVGGKQSLFKGLDGSGGQSSSYVKSISGLQCTPAVRGLAKQYGIDIYDVPGTGKDGRVLKEDVLSYAAAKDFGKKAPSILYAESEVAEESLLSAKMVEDLLYQDKIVQLRGFQRAMVKSMTMAAKIPHFHYVEDISCDALVELKASFQNQNSDPTVKHTFLPFLVKSLSLALSKYPLMNGSFNEEMHEITLKGAHNIGIAMATPYGLVVPNIKRVQFLSILEITRELSRLQQLAVDNKLTPDDISGGTITLSNIGAIGGRFGSPIINLPEVAIIAIGRIQKVPKFTDDENVYPASMMSINIGADHRVLDGATVARFCNEWKLLIENPEMLLLHMK
ncbi:Dihydrolipoamide acetyltransferase component of pyruvate dehydrogenase complex [Dionaea muscipula]